MDMSNFNEFEDYITLQVWMTPERGPVIFSGGRPPSSCAVGFCTDLKRFYALRFDLR